MEKAAACKKEDPVTIVKSEPASGDEIKEYAETAMNELLGWYGYDGRSSHEDNRLHSGGDSSEPDSPRGPDGVCGWCSRQLDGVTTTGAFCSELCFSQSRRASFKRNKTCDWCRHVRHTVSYVDFQDGARQLQFCSDKCLNQYKMQIFCRETRAHLELHPHLHRTPSSSDDGSLITPDLWLRDCRDDNRSPAGSTDVKRKAPARKTTSRKPRNARTATVTSESTESPQDLRVRPRSPLPDAEPPVKETQPVTAPSSIPTDPVKPSWPPPVTVLVPYPILIPIPLPIPIPIPVSKFREAFEPKTEKQEDKVEPRRSRTLRRRKRVAEDHAKKSVSV